MRRVVVGLMRLVAVAIAAAVAYTVWKVPERETLDAAARAGAPGKFVALSAGITHYELSGPDTGRTVVLVHGFSVPYYIWDSTVVALRGAGFRVLRYDVFGRGFSDRPDGAYDGAMFDRQLNDLLDSLRIAGPVDLMGLSFGGFVTAHYVVGNAARVRTLTLVDPVSVTGAVPSFLRMPLLGQWFFNVTQLPGRAEGQLSDFLHPERYPTWVEQYRPQMRFRGFGRALLRSSLATAQVSWDTLYASAGRTGVPVLLVWGRQDQTIPFKYSEVVLRNIPKAEFAPVDSSGHLPHIEQAQFFNKRVFEFLGANAAR